MAIWELHMWQSGNYNHYCCGISNGNLVQAAGYMQRKIAERILLPDLRTASGTEASTSGRLLKTT